MNVMLSRTHSNFWGWYTERTSCVLPLEHPRCITTNTVFTLTICACSSAVVKRIRVTLLPLTECSTGVWLYFSNNFYNKFRERILMRLILRLLSRDKWSDHYLYFLKICILKFTRSKVFIIFAEAESRILFWPLDHSSQHLNRSCRTNGTETFSAIYHACCWRYAVFSLNDTHSYTV